MKKYLVVLLLLFGLTLSSPSIALARAGGSSGGGGSVSVGGSGGGGGGSRTTTNNSDNYGGSSGYRYGRGYGYQRGYGRGIFTVIKLILMLITILAIIPNPLTRWLRGLRHTTINPDQTIPLDNETQAVFEDYFYQVEQAWSTNDLAPIHTILTPHFERQQQRILNRYQRQHKRNILEDITIVDTNLILPEKAGSKKIVVTAQMRDYFINDRQSTAANDQQRENAYIERFTEIWTLQLVDGQYQINQIKQ